MERKVLKSVIMRSRLRIKRKENLLKYVHRTTRATNEMGSGGTKTRRTGIDANKGQPEFGDEGTPSLRDVQ